MIDLAITVAIFSVRHTVFEVDTFASAFGHVGGIVLSLFEKRKSEVGCEQMAGDRFRIGGQIESLEDFTALAKLIGTNYVNAIAIGRLPNC